MTLQLKHFSYISAMQRKILRLVMTDFCCWVPICIMAFVKLAGAPVSDTAYAFSAIILLPLNSALNPILYSSLLDSMIRKCCGIVHSEMSKNTSCTSSSDKYDKNEVMMNVTNQSDHSTPKIPNKSKISSGKLYETTPASRNDWIEEISPL